MANIGTTQVYQINERLVVASDIVEAIGIYKEYYTSIDKYNMSPEIESVSLIKDNQVISTSAALMRNPFGYECEKVKGIIPKLNSTPKDSYEILINEKEKAVIKHNGIWMCNFNPLQPFDIKFPS